MLIIEDSWFSALNYIFIHVLCTCTFVTSHVAAGKFRVLMRRDKILKIACNHFITADMRLSAMQTSETAWCWNAVDFAENQPRNEQLALKFKVSQQLALNSRSVSC